MEFFFKRFLLPFLVLQLRQSHQREKNRMMRFAFNVLEFRMQRIIVLHIVLFCIIQALRKESIYLDNPKFK